MKYPWYTPYSFSGNKVISFVELEGLEEGRLNEDGTRSPDGPTVENLEPDATKVDDEINGGQLETVEITYTPKVLIKQYTSNTFTTQIFGSNEPPVYHFIYPENQGTWGQEGSDGLIWIGCMSCHAENGAYRYAAYNSQEHLRGILGAFSLQMVALPLAMGEFAMARGVSVGAEAEAVENIGPTGRFYSVAFEMELAEGSYPGVSRYMHFKEANIALESAMASNPALEELGIVVPKNPNTGSILGKSPLNWVWHHDIEKGILQLVPKSQHPSIPGGIFWETMHPDGIGGYSIWGIK